MGQGSAAGVAEKTEVPAPCAGVVSLLAVRSLRTLRIGAFSMIFSVFFAVFMQNFRSTAALQPELCRPSCCPSCWQVLEGCGSMDCVRFQKLDMKHLECATNGDRSAMRDFYRYYFLFFFFSFFSFRFFFLFLSSSLFFLPNLPVENLLGGNRLHVPASMHQM